MNEQQFMGNWKELKGKIKEQWGKLIDDNVEQLEGKHEQLIGAVQYGYGKSLAEAKAEMQKWRDLRSQNQGSIHSVA